MGVLAYIRTSLEEIDANVFLTIDESQGEILGFFERGRGNLNQTEIRVDKMTISMNVSDQVKLH